MYWPLQENVLTEEDLDRLVFFIQNTKRFTQYEQVAAFEAAFSKWQGCEHSVFVNSGSSANFILVDAVRETMGWRPGDEVIVPAVTWPTTVTPIIQLGLTPVFVDVGLRDLSYDQEKLREAVTDRTRAVFVVHLLGFPADVAGIQQAVAGSKIPVLIMEDCCEAQGATFGDRKVGNWGIGGTFSFYWGHHMTTVEGGMVCTGHEGLYRLLRMKRSHGLARELPTRDHASARKTAPDIDFKFLFLTGGYNVRNTEFAAILGMAQLERVDEFVRIRNANYARFVEMCGFHSEHLIPVHADGVSSFALPFIFRDRKKRSGFEERLAAAGIETRPLISGNLLRQPFLTEYGRPEDFPNADFLHHNAFYIGNNQFVDAEKLDTLEGLMVQYLR